MRFVGVPGAADTRPYGEEQQDGGDECGDDESGQYEVVEGFVHYRPVGTGWVWLAVGPEGWGPCGIGSILRERQGWCNGAAF